jgi:hypothetical protein
VFLIYSKYIFGFLSQPLLAQTVFPAEVVAVMLAHQLNRSNRCASSFASIWSGPSALEWRDFSELIRPRWTFHFLAVRRILTYFGIAAWASAKGASKHENMIE